MIRRIEISPDNEHRFVTYDDVIADTRYNQHQFDREWYMLLIREWQDYKYYAQKRQFLDKCSVVIWALPDSDVKLQLYKCDGTLFDEYDMDPVLQANGDPFPAYNNGNEFNEYGFFDALFWSNPDLTEGRYCFVIQITNGANVDKVICEPIELAELHDGTILLETTNRENRDFCLFEQSKRKFSLRFEGDILDFEALVERESFIDRDSNTTELKGTAYRGWTLWAGTTTSGIPDYLFDMLNHQMVLTSKRIEGKGYVAADGAAWIKEDAQGSPLTSGSIKIREQNIQDAYTIVKGSFTVIPATPYPWVNMFVSVGKDNIDDFYYNPGKPSYITDDASRDDFVDLLNDAVIAAGLDGMFDVVDGNIDYILGINETYDESSAPILTKFVKINSVTPTSGQNLNTYVGITSPATGGSSAYAFITPSGVQQGEYFSGSGIYPILSPFVAGAAGTYSQYLFHDDTLERVEVSGDYIMNFDTSKFPVLMEVFRLFNCPRMTSFDIFNTLLDAKNSLKILLINDNALLTNITNYSYYPFGIVPGNSMYKLQQINFRRNKLSGANIDNFYNNMKAAMPSQFNVYNGEVDTGGQVPFAAPNNFPVVGNSSQARSLLMNTYHWTVIIV